jgi:hypothetical protein
MGQSLLVLALPSEIGLRLDSLPSTQTTASPTAGIANIVHVSGTPEVAPEPQPTTVASCHSMATRPSGLATRATPLPLVTMSQILETAPGPQPTTAARLIAEGIRQLCLATPARALAPALSRNHTLARTCAPPTPTNQPLSTAL